MNIVVNMRKALNNSQDGRAASYTLDVVSAWAVTVSRPVGPSKLSNCCVVVVGDWNAPGPIRPLPQPLTLRCYILCPSFFLFRSHWRVMCSRPLYLSGYLLASLSTARDLSAPCVCFHSLASILHRYTTVDVIRGC